MTNSHFLAFTPNNCLQKSFRLWPVKWLLLLLLFLGAPGQAQLAKNFYYINRIESRVLPNAVQITIRTDGVAQFGGDLSELFVLDNLGRYQTRTMTSLRLRFLKARAKLPVFNEVGAYPVDGAVVTPGRDELVSPYLNGYAEPGEPVTDVELRFYVPVRLMRFAPYGSTGDIGNDEDGGGYNFSDVLAPLEVGVELGRDRRSVVITVISDRVDALRTPSLNRAPKNIKRRLSVQPVTGKPGQYRFDVLHTPLRRVLDAVSQATGTQLIARGETAELDISLLLPSATSGELLQALTVAYDLTLAPIPLLEGGGLQIGRGGDLDVTSRVPLNYLTPGNARLLFPDFLLPRLRVDSEKNALLATGTPRLVARIARDIELLDQPRPQVRVEASAWEVTGGASFDLALRAAFDGGGKNLGGVLDLGQGEAAIVMDPARAKAFSASITALQTSSRARLVAKPFVQVASGQTGLLFSGQNRFITVLRRRRGQQNLESLKLQIGYSLEVTPRVGGVEKDAEILLQLHPTISNVLEIETGTGLPTLSLREVDTALRVRPGDTVILAGLESQFESEARRGFLAPAPSRRDFESRTALIFLVTVARADSAAAAPLPVPIPAPVLPPEALRKD